MAQVLPEMNSDRRRKFMKKRSIGILLLGLAVCTCISGCGSQSIADVNEKSIQAEEETETKDEKKDVVIKKPEDSTKPLLREQATPLSKGNRLLSKNETATYRGIEISVVDVLVADSKEEAGLTEEELAYFSGQNGGEDIDTTKKNENWEYTWPFVRIRLKNTMNEEQDICAGQLELYNVYDDGEYKKVTKVSEGASEVYNADYVGTDYRNFVSLQPGEERIVTVSYTGLSKYQSKGYSSKDGVLFTDVPTMENVYMKTYAIGNVQEEEPLICLNIKNGKVVDE
ncbi:unknown [Eubacterium sp. CAG:38]|nr:unknown [Eubacterium sp. CAG:38]